MVSINGQKLSCGLGTGSNECPVDSTCVADPLNRSGVCCPTVGMFCFNLRPTVYKDEML